jgi:hypothetical protein
MQPGEEKDFPEQSGFTVKAIAGAITGGDIRTAIIRTAEREGVSLISTGSQRKGILKCLISGNVS